MVKAFSIVSWNIEHFKADHSRVDRVIAGKAYCVLFLHVASSNEPRGFGLRDDMAIRAIKFRKVLDANATDKANYLFMGDLNTMGLDYPYQRTIDVTRPGRTAHCPPFPTVTWTTCMPPNI